MARATVASMVFGAIGSAGAELARLASEGRNTKPRMIDKREVMDLILGSPEL
jgi:hypothetical protein